MTQASTSEATRYGLLHYQCDAIWADLKPESVQHWQGQLQNWTGKPDDLRRHLPVLEYLAQVRDSDFEPLRQMALELRANCDDLIVVGSGFFMDQARLHELFDGPIGRVARLHFPRSKVWHEKLLPTLEAIGSRVGLILLGWCPEDPVWDRTVMQAVNWMKKRYRGDEFKRRVVAVSSLPIGQLLDAPVRHLSAAERSHLAPSFSAFGLFPLYLAGFEASSLIEGARSQVRALEKSWSIDNPLVRSAIIRQVLTFQEGWGEVVVTPDRFAEPLGLWALHLLQPLVHAVEPALPYPFPLLQCAELDHYPGERSHCHEFVLDYACQEPIARQSGCPASSLALPRLDMYTLGGALAFIYTSVALNARWLDFEPLALEEVA